MAVEIPSTVQPKPQKAMSEGYSNLEALNECPIQARRDIESWLKTRPNYSDPALGYSNLAAMTDDALQPEVRRQKRMGFA